MDFNTKDTEVNKDNPYQFDLVKAASGRLPGAVLAPHSWPALENRLNTLDCPTPSSPSSPSFVAKTRYQLETHYIDEFIDAIDYAVAEMDINHVSIDSDFNDGGDLIGWRDVSDACNVMAGLIPRGYSDTDIEKLWDGNFLHVWKGVRTLATPTSNQACQALR